MMRYLFNYKAESPTLKWLIGVVGVGLMLSVALAGRSTAAEVTTPPAEKSSIFSSTQALEQRVHALLDKAQAHVQRNGIGAVNDFNHSPNFIDNELYLFSLSRSGIILSSGGWSASLIGQNVVDLTDDEGRPFFQQMLDRARSMQQGSVEYLWFNPMEGGTAPKITYFRVVDDVIIASGYAPQVSTEEEAKTLLEAAVSEYFSDPVLAMRKFRNKHSQYRNIDQYVFVLDKAERTVVWNPITTHLNGRPLDQVEDIKGVHFLTEMADKANPNRIQQIDYWWFSPITGQVELRRAFYQQVGDAVLAVGTFVLMDAP